MCHKILLPSKGSNAWRNIPFLTIVVFTPQLIYFLKFYKELNSGTFFTSSRQILNLAAVTIYSILL